MGARAIYVAAASAELARARRVMAELRRAGWTVTRDWTRDMVAAAERGRSDEDLDDEEARDHAERDVAGVLAAEVVLVLAPAKPSRGVWYELAVARHGPGHREREVIVAGPACRASIFTRLAGILCSSDEEALQLLNEPFMLREL